MNQQTLAQWLKCITVVIAAALALFFFLLVPWIGHDLMDAYPEAAQWYWVYLIAVWIAAVPCGTALAAFWKICANIGRDRSFCHDNAVQLRFISRLALADVIWCVIVTTVLVCVGAYHFSFLIAAAFLVLAGAGIAIAAAALSHLTEKAARLKDENDLTI